MTLLPRPPHLPEGVVAVAMAVDRGRSREWSTVLLAKGVPHWTAELAGGVAVFVSAEDEELARGQIAAYDREQRLEDEAGRRRPPPLPEMGGSPWPGLGLAALLLGGLHWWKVTRAPELAGPWARDGVAMIDQGEWWRAATALAVHADLPHLLGNLSFGLLLMWFVLHAYGRRLGWLWVGLAGVVGNVLVAATYYPEAFRAVGASTAVFGAVGLLVVHGMVWSRGGRGMRRHGSWLAPLGGGLALLGVFGSGGGDTDVDLAAHLAGFAAGMAVGAPVSIRQRWCRVVERPVPTAAIS
ncbi:MAG: rhomboid family intramembrane serine protease [Verrucomicrobiales bacterium]